MKWKMWTGNSSKLLMRPKQLIRCRIWSWSLMTCEKHGPRDSVDKTEAKGRGFCRYWGLRAMCFTRHERPWSKPIIARWLTDSFLVLFAGMWILMLQMGNFWLTSRLLKKLHCCYGLVAKGHRWIIFMRTWTLALLDYMLFCWTK